MRLVFGFLCLVCLTGAFNPFRFFSDLEKMHRRDSFSKKFNHNITNVEDKLEKLKQRVINKLTVTDKANKEMIEKLKDYRVKPIETVNKNGDTIQDLNINAQVDEFLYQNDIMLTDEQVEALMPEVNETADSRTKRQAYRDRFYPRFLWKDNIVNYEFDSSCTENMRTVFQKAASIWSSATCLTFVQTATAANRIKVFRGEGCYSYIGMIGGVQELSLGAGCDTVGIAGHEIGHALGFFHQQSRHDRDEYITVNINNIQPHMVSQFQKETQSTNFNYGLPYDYGSVMQYGGKSASSNRNPTMIAKDIKFQDTMGSHIIGFYDTDMINRHYNCKAKCPEQTSAKCANGGFPNPKRCNVCVCPAGYSGNLCNARPSGCGSELSATDSWKRLDMALGNGKTVNDFSYCTYWIKTEPGQKIEIKFNGYAGVFTDGCVYGGIEIKTLADPALTGYRFCSNVDKGRVFTSTSNLVPVIFYDRYGKTQGQVEYRAVKSSSPTPGASSDSCKDNAAYCPNYVKNGLCTDPFYNDEIRRKNCARSCGLC